MICLSHLQRMIQPSHLHSTVTSPVDGRRRRQAAVLVFILGCSVSILCSRHAAAEASLVAPLERAEAKTTQLHIFYVHGMGIDPPKAGTQDFEASQEFRKRFCKLVRCTSDEFERRDYASQGHFALNAPPPSLSYFGEALWKPSANNDDWHAAAPFVDHYRLVLRENSTAIHIHEINWWPLVFSAKCRQIVAKEAALVGRDRNHIKTCSAPTMQDDSDHPGRFRSYAWIDEHDVKERGSSWPQPAVINRALKRNLLDWGFADALLAVGPMQKYIIEGIRELVENVLDSYPPAENQAQEFIIVAHSLGSYLIFSALDVRDSPQASITENRRNKFEIFLSQTSQAYFMANQIRLLELANLDDSQGGKLPLHLEHPAEGEQLNSQPPAETHLTAQTAPSHLQNWIDIRRSYQRQAPQIFAWSDPDDLLTWQVPDLAQVQNLLAKNACRWFRLLANPLKAHVRYVENESVLRTMLHKPKPD